MSYSYAPLKIGNVVVPTAEKEGYDVTPNPVWSKNAGRSGTAFFVGDIVAYKYTIRHKITEATQAQVTALSREIKSSPFHTVEFTTEEGEHLTGSFYAAPVTYKTKVYRNGEAIYIDVQIELIEQ